jgi:hypothetical protein
MRVLLVEREPAKKDACGTGAFSRPEYEELQIEVHEEFVRMRAQTQGVVFLHFHVDPVIKEVLGENVSLEKEIVIGL